MTKPKELKVGDRVLIKDSLGAARPRYWKTKATVHKITGRGYIFVICFDGSVLFVVRSELRKLPDRKEGE